MYVIEDITLSKEGFILFYRERYCRVIYSALYNKNLLSQFEHLSKKRIQSALKKYLIGC